MLGFDFPMMPASTVTPSLGRFENYQGLTATDRDKIIHGNAFGLLPGLASRIG
jgi:hypothetical protein